MSLKSRPAHRAFHFGLLSVLYPERCPIVHPPTRPTTKGRFFPHVRQLNRSLAYGMTADITIFDPATIIDRATYANPVEISECVKYVLVNGQLEFEAGRLTGAQAGRVLRGPGWERSE